MDDGAILDENAVPRSKRQKRNPQELKLLELHMKRKVPHLYLNKLTESRQDKLNDFNGVVRQALLSPQRHRQVATLREERILEKSINRSR